jgi:hypothetical protein
VMKRLISMTKPKKRESIREKSATKTSNQNNIYTSLLHSRSAHPSSWTRWCRMLESEVHRLAWENIPLYSRTSKAARKCESEWRVKKKSENLSQYSLSLI